MYCIYHEEVTSTIALKCQAKQIWILNSITFLSFFTLFFHLEHQVMYQPKQDRTMEPFSLALCFLGSRSTPQPLWIAIKKPTVFCQDACGVFKGRGSHQHLWRNRFEHEDQPTINIHEDQFTNITSHCWQTTQRANNPLHETKTLHGVPPRFGSPK